MRVLQTLFISLVVCLVHTQEGRGQVTFILDSVPTDTPRGSSFYLSGTLNRWAANNPSYMFRTDGYGRMSLTIESVPDTFEYKICRGTWTSVETSITGKDIPNRIYTDSLGTTVIVGVERWRDRVPSRELVSTASENVHFTPTTIEIPQLDRRRTIRVYFPPNYARRQGFPVIYMLDGQNLFDSSTAFSGEWRIDETLDELFRTRTFACIVVGIYHGEGERLNEHTPWPNDEKEGGDGARLARFIVRDLKPYIDNHYRTLPDRDNTAFIGSSYGGLMAMYMALEYPNVFGKVGVFSPTLCWSERIFNQMERFRKRNYQQIYLMAGEQEDESMIDNLTRAHDLLVEVGFGDHELILKTHPDGRHSEWFWGREFAEVVRLFFGL